LKGEYRSPITSITAIESETSELLTVSNQGFDTMEGIW